MPFFLEQLYQLSERDQQVTWLDPVFQVQSAAIAAGSVAADIVLTDRSRALLLQHASGGFDPGAAQAVLNSTILVFRTDVNAGVRLKSSDTALGADVIARLDWQGSLIVPPNWTIRAAATFSAAVAANESILHIAGILVPVGNIQRV